MKLISLAVAALLCAASSAKEEQTGPPGPGIEAGTANGMAGGRTDEGPTGGTGIRSSTPDGSEEARAKANDQARGPNEEGSFLRPAETPPQINTDPHPIGSPVKPKAAESDRF
jgi:hypothetical protein